VNYAELPMEISLGGVFFPPLLLASIAGVLVAALITMTMNRYDWNRFVWHPPLFFVSLAVICTGIIGIFFIPI
jgi:integral membrane sensor domain MASE1